MDTVKVQCPKCRQIIALAPTPLNASQKTEPKCNCGATFVLRIPDMPGVSGTTARMIGPAPSLSPLSLLPNAKSPTESRALRHANETPFAVDTFRYAFALRRRSAARPRRPAPKNASVAGSGTPILVV